MKLKNVVSLGRSESCAPAKQKIKKILEYQHTIRSIKSDYLDDQK